MKIYVVTDTDANGEDRTVLAAADTPEQARRVWQDYFEIEDDDSHGTMPERIFETDLRLSHFVVEPFALGWHNDHMRQVGGTLS